jgi:hypothetical protein
MVSPSEQFVSINPLASHNIDARRVRHKTPGVIGNESVILNLHSTSPIGVWQCITNRTRKRRHGHNMDAIHGLCDASLATRTHRVCIGLKQYYIIEQVRHLTKVKSGIPDQGYKRGRAAKESTHTRRKVISPRDPKLTCFLESAGPGWHINLHTVDHFLGAETTLLIKDQSVPSFPDVPKHQENGVQMNRARARGVPCPRSTADHSHPSLEWSSTDARHFSPEDIGRKYDHPFLENHHNIHISCLPGHGCSSCTGRHVYWVDHSAVATQKIWPWWGVEFPRGARCHNPRSRALEGRAGHPLYKRV